MPAGPVPLGSGRGRRILAAAAAVLALATKDTREDPAHHAAGTEEDQPQPAAGLETTMEIR
jgi:hypothetical protein